MTMPDETMTEVGSETMRFGQLSMRNAAILNAAKEGQIPLLPFEAVTLKDEMSGHAESQKNLSKLLGQAMEQSSETWHDNAPADAINAQAGILANRANGTILAIKNGSILEYPDAAEKQVTIGSLVVVQFGNGDPEHVFMTGYTRELPETISPKMPVADASDITLVTMTSPLGRAIFNGTPGKQVDYAVNGRTIKVLIVGISQFNGETVEPVEG